MWIQSWEWGVQSWEWEVVGSLGLQPPLIHNPE